MQNCSSNLGNAVIENTYGPRPILVDFVVDVLVDGKRKECRGVEVRPGHAKIGFVPRSPSKNRWGFKAVWDGINCGLCGFLVCKG